MKKNIITITLLSLLSFIYAETPTPLPTPIICPNNYAPICAEDDYGSQVTFANICKFENIPAGSFIDHPLHMKHEGKCNPSITPTPTPYPLPAELSCDSTIVTTKANNIHIVPQYFGVVHTINSRDAYTNHPNITINPLSLAFVDADGALVHTLTKENIGTWYSTQGNIEFIPAPELENNTTISVEYVINNNCDYTTGISNKATITLDINNTHLGLLPNESCVFDNVYVDAIDDEVTLRGDEKIKIISVLLNDNNFDSSTDYIPASLRLIDKNNHIKRRIMIEHEGTWLADTNSGEILFVPEKDFIGTSTIHYAIHSACSYQMEDYPSSSKAKITITRPTPTPTTCPQTKKPVCGQENLCKVSPSGETICLASIPRNTTYTNMCELFKAGDVFLYAGACHTPTPTPTPKIIYVEVTPTPKPTPTITPTPKASPKPKVVKATEEPKPTTKPTQTVETNTTQKTSNIQSSDGSALGILSLFILMLLTLTIGRGEINRIG